jgi:hypothetical protein
MTVESFAAHRATKTQDNRGLTLDDLVQIVRDDPDHQDATGYIIIPVRVRAEDRALDVGASFRSNISRAELTHALSMTLHRTMEMS